MRRVLLTELRRGAGFVMAVPTLMIGAGLVYAERRDWLGEWTVMAYTLRYVLFLVGPIILATAAWQGGREPRRHLVELFDSTPTSRLRRSVVALASPVTTALVVVIALIATMSYLVARNTSYGSPQYAMLVSVVASVVMFAVVGYALGRAWSWRLAAPVLALASFIAIGFLDVQGGAVSYLSPAALLYHSERVPLWWPLALTSMFVFVALAGLLMATGRALWSIPAVALVVASALPILNEGADAITIDRDGQEFVCADGSPQVCVQRVHDRQLDQVAASVQAAFSGISLSRSITENPDDAYVPGDLAFQAVAPDASGNSDIGRVLDDASRGIAPWDCSGPGFDEYGEPHTDQFDEQFAEAVTDVQVWIAERPNGGEPFGILDGQTDGEAVAVANSFHAAVVSCDVVAARAALGLP